jgi:magnesium-transporting ATPase (P-type)
VLGITDSLKPNAKSVIENLIKMGIEPIMITGDHERTAKAIATQLGIRRYFAEVLPSQKLQRIEELQAIPKAVVAMVGDGINDAPALTKADIGVAIGTGTDIAIESADIVLIQGDLRNLIAAIVLSKRTYNKMIQNLFWAFIYNFIGIPFAAGVFYNLLGFFLPPGLASLAMALSSASVVLAALLLKRLDLNKIKEKLGNAASESLPSKLSSLPTMSIQTPSELTENEPESASKLVCEKCGHTEPLPKHCGRDMIPHEGKLVCWMNLDPKFGGMNCSTIEVPEHCNQKMKIM